MWTPTFENGILVKQSHCQINLSLQKLTKTQQQQKRILATIFGILFVSDTFHPKGIILML